MAGLRARGRIICWAAACLLLCGIVQAWAEQPPAGAVARVNGKLLTERDLSEAIKSILPPYFHSTDEDTIARYRERGIERLIEGELYFQAAKAMGMKPDSKALREEKERAVERYGGKKKFQDVLKKYELTDEQYMDLLAKRMLLPRFVKEQIEDKAAVSDAEARAHYDANRSDFKRPEARNIHHILIKVEPAASPEEIKEKEAKAIDLRRKIVEGAEFETLAWDNSDDDYRVKGGNLGLVHAGMLAPEVEVEAWKLKAGELSEVIRTIYGFHIIRVGDIKQPEQLEYDAVAQKLKKSMYEKKLKETRERVLGDLRSKAKIEVYAK